MNNRCDRCGDIARVFYEVTICGHTRREQLCHACAEEAQRGTDALSCAFEDALFPMAEARRVRTYAQDKAEKECAPETREEPSLAALKAALRHALRREDYLKAASLRDRIRAAEGRENA